MILTVAEVAVKYDTSTAVSTIRARIDVIYESTSDRGRLYILSFDDFMRRSAAPTSNIRQFVYNSNTVLWDSRYGMDCVDAILTQNKVKNNPIP